jgi:hypothetical protein
MFASRTKKQIQVGAGEEAGTVTIRKLSAKSLDKARMARQSVAAALTSQFGADLIRAFRETAAMKPQEVPGVEDPEARYAQYDRETVLLQGIESWTFKEALTAGIPDLDEESSELLFREIVDLSDPLKAEAERVEKNA